MKKNNGFYIYGAVLCMLGVAFLGIAFAHPELSFPWPNWVTAVLAVIYLIHTALVFTLPKWKDAGVSTCAILAIQFLAIGLLAISIGVRKNPGESNWYLPAALFLTCAGNFWNLFNNRKAQKEKKG